MGFGGGGRDTAVEAGETAAGVSRGDCQQAAL